MLDVLGYCPLAGSSHLHHPRRVEKPKNEMRAARSSQEASRFPGLISYCWSVRSPTERCSRMYQAQPACLPRVPVCIRILISTNLLVARQSASLRIKDSVGSSQRPFGGGVLRYVKQCSLQLEMPVLGSSSPRWNGSRQSNIGLITTRYLSFQTKILSHSVVST